MSAYYTVGRTKEILPLLEATLSAQCKRLGKDDPTSLDSMNALARMMATSPLDDLRNGTRSIELATEACQLTSYRNPAFIDTLAAAYAETGDFESAIKWSQSALELLDDDAFQLREEIIESLKSYQAKKPLRIDDHSDTHKPIDASDSARPGNNGDTAQRGK